MFYPEEAEGGGRGGGGGGGGGGELLVWQASTRQNDLTLWYCVKVMAKPSPLLLQADAGKALKPLELAFDEATLKSAITPPQLIVQPFCVNSKSRAQYSLMNIQSQVFNHFPLRTQNTLPIFFLTQTHPLTYCT